METNRPTPTATENAMMTATDDKIAKGLDLRIRTCRALAESVRVLSDGASVQAYCDADRAHVLAIANLVRYCDRHGIAHNLDMTR